MHNFDLVAVLALSMASSSCFGGDMADHERKEERESTSLVAPNSVQGSSSQQAELRAELEAMVKTVESVFDSYPEYVCDLTPEECAEEDRWIAEQPMEVFDCGYADGIDAALEGDTGLPMSTEGLITLAKTVYYVESAGSGNGYPESTWKPELERHVQHQLHLIAAARKLEADDGIGGAYGSDLMWSLTEYPIHIVHDMDVYRRNVNPSLERLVPMDGCGAGETDLIVRTSPEAKKVRMLPGFLGSVCRLDPRAHIAECKYWTDVNLNESRGASGIYEYEATWPDGKVTYGRVDVDSIALAAEGSTPVLTIRR
jgi:hypothetical protein